MDKKRSIYFVIQFYETKIKPIMCKSENWKNVSVARFMSIKAARGVLCHLNCPDKP